MPSTNIETSKPSINLFWLGSTIPSQYKLAAINCKTLNHELYNMKFWFDSRYLTEDEITDTQFFCHKNAIKLLDIKDHIFWHDNLTGENDFKQKDLKKIVSRVDILRLDNKILDNGIYIDLDAAGKLQLPFPELEIIREDIQNKNCYCMFNIEYHHPIICDINNSRINQPGISNSLIITPNIQSPYMEFIEFLKHCIKTKEPLFVDTPTGVHEREVVEHSTGPDYIMVCLLKFLINKNNQNPENPKINFKKVRSSDEVNSIVRFLESQFELISKMGSVASYIFNFDQTSFLQNRAVKVLSTDLSWTENGKSKLRYIDRKIKYNTLKIQSAFKKYIDRKTKDKNTENNELDTSLSIYIQSKSIGL